ncbi:hypothetical protein [Bradyrhizobium sp.]|uniref:hypothetical protein n=1 Tax=Bradyrhizobium sp. TaxID=376 RepID=UPI002E047B99|nr:hypothetical protein [Bradyrhizobium sp.]
MIQLAGAVLACEASVLKDAALQSITLLSVLIRHEQTMFAQAQQSTACMANHDVRRGHAAANGFLAGQVPSPQRKGRDP